LICYRKVLSLYYDVGCIFIFYAKKYEEIILSGVVASMAPVTEREKNHIFPNLLSSFKASCMEAIAPN